jgi:hypothetical protein
MDEKCNDVSPSTWHVAAVNQMGIHRRSFVMDGTYDAEVWNFPLLSYKYRYFNPQTLKESVVLNSAIVPKEKFRLDKFPEFRDPRARYVVGVYMDVTYVIEIHPTQRSGEIKNPTKTVRYIYDLELDENKNIIGGEWYSNAHPDFLWTFGSEEQAMSYEDRNLIGDSWDIRNPVPPHWTDLARKASARGSPLHSFLFKITQQ